MPRPGTRPSRNGHPAEFDAAGSIRRSTLSIRPRYVECDPMGVVHHSVYAVWFEMGRTEMLRECGGSYRSLEEQGHFLVVVDLATRFRRPARYDDDLRLETHLIEGTRARFRHGYHLVASTGELLASATSTIACIDAEGALRPIPAEVTALAEG